MAAARQSPTQIRNMHEWSKLEEEFSKRPVRQLKNVGRGVFCAVRTEMLLAGQV
jgi:hypothetical protein